MNGEPVCAGDWCWISATGAAKFNILTLRKPGQEPYDVVSNSQSFYQCQESLKLQGLGGGGVSSLVESNRINSFICYQEGNRFSWADCNIAATNGIKSRLVGEGSYSLPVVNSDLGSEIILGDQQYQFYGQSTPGWDFNGYDTLDFYLAFNAQTDPAATQVMMQVVGKHGKYFEENILSYVKSGVTFEPGIRMHVQVPLGDANWQDVEHIFFIPNVEGATIAVEKVRLTSAQQNNPICAGNKWFNELDQVTSADRLAGKQMCEGLGLSWVENTSENYETTVKCCGDDANEYSWGANGIGCWNSRSINAGETAALIQYKITSGKEQWNYAYPQVPITAILTVEQMENGQQVQQEYTLSGTVSAQNSPAILLDENGQSISVNPSTFISATLTTQTPDTQVYFFFADDLGNQAATRTSVTSEEVVGSILYVVAQVNTLTRTHDYTKKNSLITQTCTPSSCTFPLIGEPTFTIENPYPDLYDLYYVQDLEPTDLRILIEEPTTIYGRDGWLEAHNVKQNILYQDGTFYTCGNAIIPELAQNADIRFEGNDEQNMCRVIGAGEQAIASYFCGTDGSWYNQPISAFKYDDNDQDQQNNLEPAGILEASQRNQSTSIVYGRNLIYNPALEDNFNDKAAVAAPLNDANGMENPAGEEIE